MEGRDGPSFNGNGAHWKVAVPGSGPHTHLMERQRSGEGSTRTSVAGIDCAEECSEQHQARQDLPASASNSRPDSSVTDSADAVLYQCVCSGDVQRATHLNVSHVDHVRVRTQE